MIKKNLLIGLLFFFLISTGYLHSHGNKKHNKNENIIETPIEKKTKDDNKFLVPSSDNGINYFSELLNDLSYKDIPTLHPLVVHFPIVLLPTAILFALISLFKKNTLMFKLSLIFLFAGLIGGFIATYPLHPHTIGLSKSAFKILEKHDFFAYATLITGSLAIPIGLIYLRYFRKWMKFLYIIILFLSVLSVFITGHYGGKLSYVYGIGVKGNYLETNDSH